MEKIVEQLSIKYGNLVGNIISSLVILILGYLVSKLLSKIIMKYIEKSTFDEIVLNFIHTILKVIFFCVVILMSLSELGLNVSSLLALATALAAGIALALKETIAAFIDGIKILFAKPFVKGDLIEVKGTIGTIQEISLLYTFLLTLDNKKIIIPNTEIANTILINYSSEDTRRVDLYFDVAYESDIDKAKQIIQDVVKRHPFYLSESEPFIRIYEYKESSVSILLRAWTKTQNFEAFKYDILEDVKKEFDKENISIPYNQLDIHVHPKA